MNHMKEIANILGVNLDEEFEIEDDSSGNKFKLTSLGLKCTNKNEKNLHCVELNLLLNGSWKIKRKPYKPKQGQEYWWISHNGLVTCSIWDNKITGNLLYKIGDCYRTSEEAEKDKDKWIKFFASKENLNE